MIDFLYHFSRESIVVVFGTISRAIHKYTKDTVTGTCSLIDLNDVDPCVCDFKFECFF